MILPRLIAATLALSMAVLFNSGLISSPARAGYVVTLEEVGSDVVATGSGPIDLTDLSSLGLDAIQASMLPLFGTISTGPAPPSVVPTAAYAGGSLGQRVSEAAASSAFPRVAVEILSAYTAMMVFLWCRTTTSPAIPCRTPQPISIRLLARW